MARKARSVCAAVLGVLWVSACASEHRVMCGRQRLEVVLPDEPNALIQMKRNGCSDEPCPVYSISIFPDGTAIYDGRANVGVIGRRTLKVRASDLCALITALDEMDFLDSAENCCTCIEPTNPSVVTIGYRPGSAAKTVTHDQRCPNAPRALSLLEHQIDRTTGADRLAGIPGRGGSTRRAH